MDWPWAHIWNYEQQVYDDVWEETTRNEAMARVAGKNASAIERWEQRTGVKRG